MSLSRNDFLLHQHRITYGAVLSFRQARLSASRLHGLVDDLRVPLGRNDFLLHQHRTTNRAVLSFGQPRLGTRRLHSRVNDFRMPSRLDLRQAGENLTADAAFCPCRTAGLGTGRLHFRHRHNGVPHGADRLRSGRGTLSTSIGFHAGSCAGRRNGDLAAVPAVPLSRNDFLLHQHRTTNRAVLPFGQSRLGARRLHGLIHDLGVGDGRVPRGELRVGGDAGIVAAPPGQFIVMRLVRRF